MKGDKKTILAIVLFIVAIGVVAYQLLGTGSSATRTATNALAAPTPSPVTNADQNQAVQQKEKTSAKQGTYEKLLASVSEHDLAFRAASFRNPMSPLVSVAMTGPAIKAVDGSKETLPSGYSIKGIIWNDTAPLALINDQVVGVGERLDDGALITEINPGSVKFTKRGNRFVLVLREE
jgi:hypothetical protein